MKFSDLLSYLPIASALVVGVVTSLYGRNGWKWATLTYFSSFAAFVLAKMPLVKLLSETLWLSPIVALALGFLLLRRLWGVRNSLAKDSSKLGSLRLAAYLAVVVVFCFFAPILSELQTISTIEDEYYMEDAVSNETAKYKRLGQFTEQEAKWLLNPDFLKHYDLSISDYEDDKGYFAPNGYHWSRWSINTRVAAVLMLDSRRKPIPTWEIHRELDKIDDYYNNNDKSVALLHVVNAISDLSAQRCETTD